MATIATSDLKPEEPASLRQKPGFHHYHRFLEQLSLVGQIVVGGICLWLAVALRGLLPGATRPMNALTIGACLALLSLALAIAAISRRNAAPAQRGRIASASVLAAAALVLASLFTLRALGNGVSRPTVLLFTALAAVAIGGWEQASARWLERSAEQQPRFLVLIGDAMHLRAMAGQLSTGPWRLAATLDDGCDGQGAVEAKLERLAGIIRSQPVDEIVLAASLLDGRADAARFYRGVIDICEQTGLRLHVVPDWLTDYPSVAIDRLSGRPILSFSFSPSSPWASLAKRAFDVSMSAALLAALWPLLLLIGALVRLDSPGPALFRQNRCGLRGRTFTIYKFRSMVANAESLKLGLSGANEMSGPVFKISRDPRITRVGRWLRKTSLDELPQLWNVLKGEMSLVGPRPPLPEEVGQYRLGSLRRLAMKPGMTGLWQVSGRNKIRDFQDWVRLDAEYIRSWSLYGDLRILARTVWAVLQMNGK